MKSTPLPETPIARELTERLYLLMDPAEKWVQGDPKEPHCHCALLDFVPGRGLKAALTDAACDFLAEFTEGYYGRPIRPPHWKMITTFNDTHNLEDRCYWWIEAIADAEEAGV